MIDRDGVATVADVSRVQALRRPDAVALEFEGRATTFAEIDALASHIANQLIGSGIAPKERIAYLAKNSDHFFEFLFGACKARVALTPINFRLAAPEIAEIIGDSGARLLIVGADFVELAEKALELLASKPQPDRAGVRPRRLSASRRLDRRRRGARSPARDRAGRRRGPALHVRDDRPTQGRATDEPQLPRALPTGRRSLWAWTTKSAKPFWARCRSFMSRASTSHWSRWRAARERLS